MKWEAWPERAWGVWSTGGGCPEPFACAAGKVGFGLLRNSGSSVLWMVSRMCPWVFQSRIKGLLLEGSKWCAPTAQQRHQHRLCLQDWLHRVFLLHPMELCCSSQSSKAGGTMNSKCPPLVRAMFYHPLQKAKAGQGLTHVSGACP